jgi:Type II transport protein GspH
LALERWFVKPSTKQSNRGGREIGLALMEVIVGSLAGLIIGSVLLHLANIGYTMYKLNAATSGVAHRLELAHDLAVKHRQQVTVMFDAKSNRYGIDRNGNRKLDNIEADDLPDGVTVSGNETVTFLPSGNPSKLAAAPEVLVSNARGSHNVSVSALGSIAIE